MKKHYLSLSWWRAAFIAASPAYQRGDMGAIRKFWTLTGQEVDDWGPRKPGAEAKRHAARRMSERIAKLLRVPSRGR